MYEKLISEARELHAGWMVFEIMRYGGGQGAKDDGGEAERKFMLWLSDEFPAMCDALEKDEAELTELREKLGRRSEKCLGLQDEVYSLREQLFTVQTELAALKEELEGSEAYIEGLNTLVDRLREAGRWIPVSEDFPKYTDNYNVVCNIGSVFCGYTEVRTYRFERILGKESKWCIPNRSDEIVTVTHWPPLPAAPGPETEK